MFEFNVLSELTAGDNSFPLFINNYFFFQNSTVQGVGIEFTDPRSYQYSGSGDDDVSDDTENGEDDTEDTAEPTVKTSDNIADENTTAKKKNNGTDTNENSVRKNSHYWKETSRRIMKGKNERRVQLLVYFDDPAQYKRNKERRKNSISLRKAWEKLKHRYQSWYLTSNFNEVSQLKT